MKKLLLYLARWQMSSPILALCMLLLPFGVVANTIIANLIGGLIFFWFDKRIFKEDNCDTCTYKLHDLTLTYGSIAEAYDILMKNKGGNSE